VITANQGIMGNDTALTFNPMDFVQRENNLVRLYT